MMYIDTVIKNPSLGEGHPRYNVPDLPSIFYGYRLEYGGSEGVVLEIPVKFNRITNPLVGLLVVRLSLRRLISKESEVEYRVHYR